MRVQAIFNGVVVADSDRTVVVEGNHYFPADAVRPEFLTGSATHTVCPWKGTASYYTVEADGARATDAAWYYPTPSAAAAQVAGRIAFWRGVKVVPVADEAAADGR